MCSSDLDADPITGNARCDQLEAAYSPSKTKAVMMAHALGNPFDLATTLAFCQKYSLWLVEDNCDALGCSYSMPRELAESLGFTENSPGLDEGPDRVIRWTGTWGDISTQSFYPPHHLTMGEGGAVNIVRDQKLKVIAESFREFKREIARGAENSRTGKPIPKRVIEQFEEMELKREEEAEKVRLKNINLRMTLKKLENSLRAKEQLAEGLHLIDFEQLKIENQTLNEKIEERNEELHKLRKKNTSNVQVLTHIKEKLQFVAAENAVVRRRLTELDAELSRERDRLTKAKRDREVLRTEKIGRASCRERV